MGPLGAIGTGCRVPIEGVEFELFDWGTMSRNESEPRQGTESGEKDFGDNGMVRCMTTSLLVRKSTSLRTSVRR